ncbi:MAG TPA: ABC transporter permease [Streptosporangiaceae bacterium]|nr:ABC transporter permease [Streptosporangiaceae bacterium]
MSDSLIDAPAGSGAEQSAVAASLTPIGAGAAGLASPHVVRRGGEFVHYAVRNPKLLFGLALEALFVLGAIIGPIISPHNATDLFRSYLHPSAQHWLGTNNIGNDLFAQLVYGLRDSYLVGALGALCASAIGMALGFIAGYRGGWLDEVLQMVTNIMVMIPSLVLLIVIGAYLTTRGVLFEGVFIGLTTWPWVARAVRAQTFTLRSRDFVDLARLSGKRPAAIVVRDIAPNMASYLFLVVVLLFGSSMLLAASYDFLGLGPTNGISLGTMMNQAMLWSALQLHTWWWFVAPGVVLTGMVVALLIANVGLDEVFNPKLRSQ